MESSHAILNSVIELVKTKTYLECLEKLCLYLQRNTGSCSVVAYLDQENKGELIPEICLQDNGINRGRILSRLDTNAKDKQNDPFCYCYRNNKQMSFELSECKNVFDLSTLQIHDAIIGIKSTSFALYPMVDEFGAAIGVIALFYSTKSRADHDAYLIQKMIEIASRILSIEKTYDQNKRLVHILNTTTEKLRRENDSLKKSLDRGESSKSIIGRSGAMKNLNGLIAKVVDSDVSVLILGETGTGKELIAESLHQWGNRRDANFVVQNCAAIPENLLESELFGYRKGAFSGANSDKPGLIEQANEGTLFLDEIGDMPLNLQAKLLRVLQEKKFRPLGASTAAERDINVRFVAATHQDLLSKVRNGEFREDLYYRLSVFPIKVPPLRERREDIPELIDYFIREFSIKYGKVIAGMTPLVMNILMKYHYPGNIRDLRNIIERAVLLVESGGYIDYQVLSEDMIEFLMPNSIDSEHSGQSLKKSMEIHEEKLIRAALKSCNWNQTKAAEKLGIARRTIIEKIQKYNINKYITRLDSTLQ